MKSGEAGIASGIARAGWCGWLRGRSASGTRLVYPALVLVLAIFLGFGLAEVYRVDGLFSYDPHYHMHLSELVESNQGIVTEIQYFEATEAPQYLTSMHLIAALIHEYSGVSYLTIYRLLGVFTRLFTALALFVTVSFFLDDERYGLIAVILFLSAPYIFLRSLIGYPENLVLPLHVLIFNSIVHTLKNERADRALPLYISAAIYIHYRSIIVPAVLVGAFAVLLATDRRMKKRFIYLFSLVAGTAALAAPILAKVLEQYRSYLKVNVGSGAAWKPFTVGSPAYNVPTINYYLEQLGIPLVILSLVGVFALLRRPGRGGAILLLWAGFTFIMTRGKQVGLYIPTDRMLSFLCVPAAVIAAAGVKDILETYARESLARMTLAALISLLLLFTLAVNLPGVHGWVGIGGDRIEAAKWLNDNVQEESVIIPYKIDLVTMGVKRYKNIAFLSSREWKETFDSPDGVRAQIKARYRGHDVYIVSGDEQFRLNGAETVYSREKVTIYRYAGV